MKKPALLLICLMSLALASCGARPTTSVDGYDYQKLTFPDFMAINPVRYAGTDSLGQEYLGWQNFGTTGEIMTNPWSRSTYTYQMYSYFIRNDLQQFYVDVPLPEELGELPEWITETNRDGRRVLWFSMMSGTLPDSITLLDTENITAENGIQTFLRAEYQVTAGESQTDWIVYFMDVEGTYSSFAIRVNEMHDMVMSTTDFIIQTYQLKSSSV